MKCSNRIRILIGVPVAIGIFIIALVLEDKCETYDPVSYIEAVLPWNEEDAHRPLPLGTQVEDKIIVVPSLEEEDVSWVVDELRDWQHAIYIVNPSSDETRASTLTTPANKGHEGMAYLTYIIDNYEKSIPSIVVFVHSHRGGFWSAWHVDTPLHDNVHAIRNLQLNYVKEKGYVNLRCNLNPGCKRLTKVNHHLHIDMWQEVMGNTSTPAFSQDGPVAAISEYPTIEAQILAEFAQPKIWGPCCAQFALTREQIYKRPLEDYVNIRQWLIDTEKNDAKSGRILEYLWHVIFGQAAIDCPNPDVCHCKVYGRC